MRETDRIASEKFNGRIREAIKYIVENNDDKTIDRFYHNEWTDRECEMADVYMAARSLSHLSIEEIHNLQRDVERSNFMSAVNMNEEEILKCKINPFTKKIAESVIVMLGVILIPFLIAWILERTSAMDSSMDFIGFVKWLVIILITPLSINLASVIRNYIKFRKLKRVVTSEQLLPDDGKKKL